MTPVDDLKVGQFIAVVKDRLHNSESWWTPPEHYNGAPMEILAISLPFICVTDGREKYALDARHLEFQRLDIAYVREMLEPHTPRVLKHLERKAKWKAKDAEPETEKPDDSCCPRCGDKMRQKRVSSDGTCRWVYFCAECQHYGAAVS